MDTAAIAPRIPTGPAMLEVDRLSVRFQTPEGSLDAVRDVRSRIHQRAVPVEDDQVKLLSGHAVQAVSRNALS